MTTRTIGKIEKQVLAILAAELDEAFTVAMLCRRVYAAKPEIDPRRPRVIQQFPWLLG